MFKPLPHKTLLAILSLTGLFVTHPNAALVIEADFSEGKDLIVGSPSTGTLTGDATVSGGALQINTNAASGVTYGKADKYLNVTSSSWGANTLVTTFSLNAAGNTRQTLMSTSGKNYNGIVLFANTDGASGGPRIAFASNWVQNSAILANNRPLANTDYFFSASWFDNNDEDQTISVQLYLRRLDDLEGTSTIYQTFLISNPSGTGGMGQPNNQDFGLGHALERSGSAAADPLNGKLYLFQGFDVFTDSQSGFDDLFYAVVPEPTTIGLLLGASGLLLARRLRRRNDR